MVDAPDLVYLDHAATTPMRPEAVAAMLPFLSERFANPSGSHRFARDARRVIDEARDVVAAVIGCLPGEVVFTSGGTESDNTAIRGVVGRRGGAAVCTAVEHHAVLSAVEQVEQHCIVAVLPDGSVDHDALESAMLAQKEPLAVASVIAVNNEVGTVNEFEVTTEILHRFGDPVIHTDAVQAACWIDLRELWPHVDMLSLSGHKFGGPKGIGVLVVRTGVAFDPLLVGGGQERERRSGTHNVAGIVAFAEALRLTDLERSTEVPRLAALRDRLVDSLVEQVGAIETVSRHRKVAGSAHVCFEGVENEALLYLLDEAGVCASAASACAAGAMEPSHVLAAMGVPRHVAAGALRLTLGRTTTDDDIDRASTAIVGAVRRLRR